MIYKIKTYYIGKFFCSSQDNDVRPRNFDMIIPTCYNKTEVDISE